MRPPLVLSPPSEPSLKVGFRCKGLQSDMFLTLASEALGTAGFRGGKATAALLSCCGPPPTLRLLLCAPRGGQRGVDDGVVSCARGLCGRQPLSSPSCTVVALPSLSGASGTSNDGAGDTSGGCVEGLRRLLLNNVPSTTPETNLRAASCMHNSSRSSTAVVAGGKSIRAGCTRRWCTGRLAPAGHSCGGIGARPSGAASSAIGTGVSPAQEPGEALWGVVLHNGEEEASESHALGVVRFAVAEALLSDGLGVGPASVDGVRAAPAGVARVSVSSPEEALKEVPRPTASAKRLPSLASAGVSVPAKSEANEAGAGSAGSSALGCSNSPEVA